MTSYTPNYSLAPLLPKDRDSVSIQVLAPDEAAVVVANIAPGNNRVALPADCEIVEVAASDACRMAFGDGTVDVSVGNRRIFPAGAAVYRVPPGVTHIAVSQYNGSTGVVSITRMY